MTIPQSIPAGSSPETVPTRVLCVDDNSDIVAVIRMMISTQPNMKFVGQLASADDLLSRLHELTELPHVVVLDATMPGRSPLSVMTEMAREFPAVRTIIYSGYDDAESIDRAINAGAWGYVSKRDDAATIVRAVSEVTSGRPFWLRAGPS